MLKRILYIFLLLISIKATAQRTNSSPYSFFGIGQQFGSESVEQASMGGIGVAYNNIYHLNFLNPAASANLRFATYTFGATASNLTVKDFSGSQSSTSVNLSYFNMGFPIGKRAGVSFGLRPSSSVGYSLFNVTRDANDVVLTADRFYGTGGTNRIYGAYGMFLAKGLSVGIEGSYLFGKTENNVTSQRANVHLATKNNEINNIRGKSLKVGLHYKKEMSNKLMLNFGAVFKLENSLTTNGNEYLYSLVIGSNSFEAPRDTLSRASISGEVINPLRTSLGFGLGKKAKWYAGVEYEFQNALNIKGVLSSSSAGYGYGNSNKLSMGGFYLPKATSITSYWDRVTYRAGMRFEKTGLLINRTGSAGGFTEINDFGISFGLGLPLKELSNLNLGFEYGKKGTTANNLIQENYFNFKLSLSLNAFGQGAWFVKRKIN